MSYTFVTLPQNYNRYNKILNLNKFKFQSMDENTAVVLTLQLVTLFSIAGALLLYLLCKIRTGLGSDSTNGTLPGAGKPVLVTSADNAIGLQVSKILRYVKYISFCFVWSLDVVCSTICWYFRYLLIYFISTDSNYKKYILFRWTDYIQLLFLLISIITCRFWILSCQWIYF